MMNDLKEIYFEFLFFLHYQLREINLTKKFTSDLKDILQNSIHLSIVLSILTLLIVLAIDSTVANEIIRSKFHSNILVFVDIHSLIDH